MSEIAGQGYQKKDLLVKIAIIAHDGKKAEMVAFLLHYKSRLQNVDLVSTGNTGHHVERAGLRVTRFLSGPLGGDAQIAALGAKRMLGAVIFFRDPLDKHPHEPDVQMLLRICDVHNIPLATNPATAHYLVEGLLPARKSGKGSRVRSGANSAL